MITDSAIIIGLTGAFGSGCTTIAKSLSTNRSYEAVKISDLIYKEWLYRESLSGDNPRSKPPRGELQDLGDARRRFHDRTSYWVEEAIRQLKTAEDTHEKIVLDGIRNPGEVRWLREQFKNFVLVAVDAPSDTRWHRLCNTPAWKGKTREEFDRISARDIDSPVEWGQHVQECIDIVDYVITNDYENEYEPGRHLDPQTERLLALLAPDDTEFPERPTPDEMFMHLAHAEASRSTCLKRQVGAVIVADSQQSSSAVSSSPRKLLGLGYNENADFVQPCYQEFKACYRDVWRKKRMLELDISQCPSCGSHLTTGYPPTCTNIDCELGENVLNTIFPERAMSHCTALHAEVRAILSTRDIEMHDASLFVTTFPCFLCAQQIIHAGIREVVYVEAYPDDASRDLLERSDVSIRRFSGVRSAAYERFFGSWRARAENLSSFDGVRK